jgi:hypothetical protein
MVTEKSVVLSMKDGQKILPVSPAERVVDFDLALREVAICGALARDDVLGPISTLGRKVESKP